MSGTFDDRAVSVSDVIDAVDDASLAELSGLALYASAGTQAIDLVRRIGSPDELCRQLAAQALALTQRISALRGYRWVFDNLSHGVVTSSADLDAARGLMMLVGTMLRQELDRRERDFDRARGIRGCH